MLGFAKSNWNEQNEISEIQTCLKELFIKKKKRKSYLLGREIFFKKRKDIQSSTFQEFTKKIFCLCCGCLTYPWHLVNSQ